MAPREYLLILIAAATDDSTSGIWTFLKEVWRQGPFIAGFVLGCTLSYGNYRLISSEHTRRIEVDLEREKELHKQLEQRDKRIASLNDKVQALQDQNRRLSADL